MITTPYPPFARLAKGLLALCVLVLLASPVALAKDVKRGGGPATAERLHERMKTLRARLLEKRVGLDAETLQEVESVFAKGDVERKGLHRAMKESHRKLRALIEADVEDGDAYEGAVNTLLKARRRLNQIVDEEAQRLQEMLTPKQMGKLVMVLHRLKKKMRKMHHGLRDGEMKGERRGRRGEGPPRRGERGQRDW